MKIPLEGLQYDLTAYTLANIAQAELKLGDRATALATLRRADELIDRFLAKKSDIEVLGSLTEIAKYQREAGDPGAARLTLERLIKLVDSLEAQPIVQELIQVSGTKEPIRRQHEMNAFVRGEMLLVIARERLALGDRELALAACGRAITVAERQKGVLKPMLFTAAATFIQKSGDAAWARDVIKRARVLANELPEQAERDGAMCFVAQSLAEIGDVKGAIEVSQKLGQDARQGAIEKIVDAFTEQEPGEGWLSSGGIKIMIGARPLKLKDREAALLALPELAEAIRGFGKPLIQARMLSMLGHLLAKAGDFDGAIRTVRLIPAIRREDFPGPSDGFYDAIKPSTLAMIAGLQFKAGDQAGASGQLLEAIALSRKIASADQALVSQIVISRTQIECNDLEAARTLLGEAIALAGHQPEPLRSRSLAMLSRSQINTADTAGAQETIRSIREYPGLEKVDALQGVAEWYERKGDQAGANAAYREALRCIESKVPADAERRMGQVKKLVAITARTFIDSEYEFDARGVEHQRQMSAMFLHANLGEIQQAVDVGRSMPPETRQVALGNLAGNLARKGQVALAMKLAGSFEAAEARLMAYDLVAVAIRDGRTGR